MNTAAIPREMRSTPLLASILPLPTGGALVTIGQITSPYANAEMARAFLRAKAAAGEISLIESDAKPSTLEASPC